MVSYILLYTHHNPMIRPVVLDANVWVAAFRSARGASRSVIDSILDGGVTMHLTVPLVVEYEEIFTRERRLMGLDRSDIQLLIDLICQLGRHHDVHYLWRMQVADPKDAHVLEAAVSAACPYLLTFNKRDLNEATTFGIQVFTPGEFLSLLPRKS